MSRLSGLRSLLDGGSLLTGEADLLSYSYDGALDRGRPEAVVLASNAEEVRRVVDWCLRRGVPFVARGAGTNLSGGCVALRGGVVISLAKLDRILEIDSETGVAVVEPGVVNLHLQKRLEGLGRFYAPDPASYRVCTLGGNAAENAGGPRCLKYGVTTNHVLAVEAVMPDATLRRFSIDEAGPEVLGLLVGAEGTLGVLTKLWLRTLPLPETIRTLLVAFPSLEGAMACVSGIIAAGVLPRVLEAMDRATVESIEAYCRAGYPASAAVLLIELDGAAAQVAVETGVVERLCRKHDCGEFRQADDPAERDRLWEGRRGAYAALARVAPNVLVEDGVVPRSALAEAARRVDAIAKRHRVRAALLFHAGDGNLHPNIAFDERDADQTRRVKAAGREILEACIELGGSISGEHGIGIDKREAMSWLFTQPTLDLFRRIKREFDPGGLSNPDKLFPSSASPPRRVSRPLSPAQKAVVDRLGSLSSPVTPRGTGTKLPEGALKIEILETSGMNAVLELDAANFTVTVEAGITLRRLREELRGRGLELGLAVSEGTVGGLIGAKSDPRLRDRLLGVRAALAGGEVVELGGKVVKNVAGYDVCKLLLGSWGSLAVILEATLRVFPASSKNEPPLLEPPAFEPFKPNPWQRAAKRAFDPGNLLSPWVFGSE